MSKLILILISVISISCNQTAERALTDVNSNVDDISPQQKELNRFTNMIASDRTNSKSYFEKAEYLTELSKTSGWLNYKKQAIDNFSEALKLDSNLAIAFILRGRLYQDMDSLDAALDDYRSYLKLRPEDVDAVKEKENLLKSTKYQKKYNVVYKICIKEILNDYDKYMMKVKHYSLDIIKKRADLLNEIGDTVSYKAEKKRIDKINEFYMTAYEKAYNTKIPRTIEQAVNLLLVQLGEEGRNNIKNTRKEDLINYHFSFGMYIRNEFWLWSGNSSLLKSCGSENMHPDDASMVIIEALWKKLQD